MFKQNFFQLYSNFLSINQTLYSVILMDENGSSVYVVDRSGGETGTELRPIELGPSYGGFTVISTGLDVGHEVITTGQTMVAEGDLLEISSNNAQ